MKISRLTSVSLMAVAWAFNAHALDLVNDYQKAITYDPTYQSALAEFESNQAQATQARVAYLPQAAITNQRLDTDTTSRQTFRITQPIVDMARIATFRQASPRQGFAEVSLIVKQHELAMRLLKGANAIVLANENIKLNTAKIDALNNQSQAAKRKLELGQGTITDLRDIEVKTAQAKAHHLSYKTALDVATKQYAAITGETPKTQNFVLEQKDRQYKLQPTPAYVDEALQKNPTLQAARFSERVAELEVQRSSAGMLPIIAATYNNSQAGGLTNTYSGVLISMPLEVGSYYSRKTSEAGFTKAKESTRDIEQKIRLDVERLRAQIETGIETLAIQKDAISAAELSLEANQKSYEGGVRSTVDILNATQTVFQVKSEYVTTATAQAENLLSLALHTNIEPQEAIATTVRYLLGK